MQAAGLQSVLEPSVYQQFALAEQINRLEFVKGVKHHKVRLWGLNRALADLLRPSQKPHLSFICSSES